jgi:hypothetical protein
VMGGWAEVAHQKIDVTRRAQPSPPPWLSLMR